MDLQSHPVMLRKEMSKTAENEYIMLWNFMGKNDIL